MPLLLNSSTLETLALENLELQSQTVEHRHSAAPPPLTLSRCFSGAVERGRVSQQILKWSRGAPKVAAFCGGPEEGPDVVLEGASNWGATQTAMDICACRGFRGGQGGFGGGGGPGARREFCGSVLRARAG